MSDKSENPMARLARINLFPIKSFDGVSVVDSEIVAPGALKHDREFACADRQGEFFTAKRTERMHRLRADFDVADNRVELRAEGDHTGSQFSLTPDNDSLLGWLSNYLGEPITLSRNVDGGFPDDHVYPGPTIISVATLETVGEWFGLELDDVRRRFRTNLEVDGVEPFWEDRLVIEEWRAVIFRIGDVEIYGMNPCQRCPVPTRNPWTGEEIHMFPRNFFFQRRDSLPSWACAERFNHFYRLAVNTRVAPASWNRSLRVGDQVEIIGRDLSC
jgi:uncharacterized protein YcbX